MRSSRYSMCLIAALAPMLLCGCAAAPGAESDAPLPVSAENAAAVDPPLPPGAWDVVYRGEQDIGRGTAQRAVFVSRDRDVVDRAVLVYRIRLGRRYEFLPRTTCSNTDYYYETSDHVSVDQGACWHVRAVNLGTAGEPHWVNQVLAEYVQQHNLYLPVAMIGVRFIRYNEGTLLQLDYLWTADLLLEPPADRVWTPADWSNAAVAADPAKQTIMRTLRRWGEEWQARVAASLPF